VTGRLVVDDTWFDDVRLGQDWSWDSEPYAYGAQLSALTLAPNADYDAGSVIVRVSPGPAAGNAATAVLIPATGHVRIENRATTSAAGSAQRIVVERRHGTNTIVVTGSIPAAGAPVDALSSVDDPSLYAADVFRRALGANRVTVRGSTVRAATPGGAAAVATHSSAPLGQILVPFLKLSNNNIAEILARAVGRKAKGAGTWNAGQQAVSDFLAANGIGPQTLRIRDGAGLSRVDGLPPEQIVKLLTAVQSKPWFSTWYGALPIAANPDRLVGGTLRSRMAGTPAANNVHAKTGSLTGVSALSGYVTSADGERLVFSIMLNGHLGAAPKDLEDAIAVRLAEFRRGVATTGTTRTTVRPLAPARSKIQQVPDPGSMECSWYKGC
jgi:D-alanyl-D-alanine carboxypeptidase/D-alanyl-D-alanine-endopeptidase (penicillin-binding protein 4)